VTKSSGKPHGDHATHLWGWIERPMAQSSIWKWSYVSDIIKGGPMMWASFIMDGNKHEGNQLVEKQIMPYSELVQIAPPLGDHLDGFT
jgi:hypothetical protein